MRTMRSWIATGTAALLLAGCATQRPVQVAQPAPAAPAYSWTNGFAPKAQEDALAAFGPLVLRPGDYRWVADVPAAGEAKVVIDLVAQRFYIYRADRLVGVAAMSSGKKGRETQLGFWSVIIKKKKGFSRKYDNAPMPFMQMYDAKGLAFHAGPNPGYPASHGCVRLPLKFAERLFDLTKIGTKVVIEG